MKSISFKNTTWIDFDSPSADDVLYLQENFNIHPIAIEEFITPTIRPRATRYNNCVFLTIHIPLYDVKARATYPCELDIVITRDHLITGHDKSIYQLEDFFHDLQESEGKRRLYMDKSPAHLLYHILELLLESCFPRLDHIHEHLMEVETSVFNGEEKEMVRKIIIKNKKEMVPDFLVIEAPLHCNL